ncbi:MAG: lipase maturation factor family protein, partial [Gemmatimonadaceae bacterium]
MTTDEHDLDAAALLRVTTARATDALIPRWIFLRALGLIFFSAFYSLARQAHGLIGAHGVLPASTYLQNVSQSLHGVERIWSVPSLFWMSSSDGAMTFAVAVGIVCSLLLVANVWPRAMIAICTLLFLSFITTLQAFSSYQSDSMLLEAGFISIWFAPRGFFPGLGALDPPSRISLFMLKWEWFRIYFESGLVKLMSGDVHWRNFTAMDDYYQNGPLPAWPGWYVQHLPHWYHAGTVALTLVVELAIVWAMFLPRRFRYACFAIVTALQSGIIATANYAFLNYLVFSLGFLLLDDDAVAWVARKVGLPRRRVTTEPPPRSTPRAIGEAVALGWIFYATLWAFLA